MATINSSKGNFEYRAIFKKSLRSYERSNSKHNSPSPKFSTVLNDHRIGVQKESSPL